MIRRQGLFFLLFVPCSLFAAPPSVTIEPLKYTPPQAERVVLKNGVVVYLQEDHELPLVELTLRIKSNPALEPAIDVFEVLGAAWRTGGTKTVSPFEFDRLLEDTATSLSLSVDQESLQLSLSSLTKNCDQSLQLAFDLLFHPDFNAEQLNLVKEQTLEGLRRQNESMAEIGRRAFRDVLYGPTHVYAQNPTLKTIDALTRPLMFRAQKNLIDPHGAILSLSGDFNKADMVTKLEKIFSGWTSSRNALPSYNFSLQSPSTGTVFFIDKDFSQSRIVMGRVGPSRHNPDEYALHMADSILGGGGPSRLFSEIRSRQGLAYAVGSVYTEREGPGAIAVVCQTMVPSTLRAARAILDELGKFSSAPPTQSELDIAQESAINSFVFGFITSENIVNAWASNEFFGYSPDYLKTYSARIAALKPADIFEVAKKYYTKESMKIVVVGDSNKIGGGLETLGPVVKIPLEKLD